MNTQPGQLAHRLAADQLDELHHTAAERRLRESVTNDEGEVLARGPRRTTRRLLVPALAGCLVVAGGFTAHAIADQDDQPQPPADVHVPQPLDIAPPRGAPSRVLQAV